VRITLKFVVVCYDIKVTLNATKGPPWYASSLKQKYNLKRGFTLGCVEILGLTQNADFSTRNALIASPSS
jgi:hypothetical protein